MSFDDPNNTDKSFTCKTSANNNILLIFNKKACEILFNEDKVNDMESLAVFIYK